MIADRRRRIFGIGLSRTGTTSLSAAMRALGIDAVHLPLSLAEIDAHQFANDSPVAARFEELDRGYPGALHVLTRRPPAKWLASVRSWLALESRQVWIDALSPTELSWLSESDERLYGRGTRELHRIGDDELIDAFGRHEARVARWFLREPERLLVLDLSRADSPPLSALVAFLERHGVLRMPHENALPAARIVDR